MSTAASLRSATIVLLYHITIYTTIQSRQASTITIVDDTHVLQNEGTTVNHASWYSTLCFNNNATSGGNNTQQHTTTHNNTQQTTLPPEVALLITV